MRAQLRTYHPIPSLQTYSDQSDYKQLQDAPRLKSILKGACDDRPEPATLEELAELTKFPKTNPINLCFIISTFASKVQTKFFVPPYEFHDLIMNQSLSSESRGKAFLWLMWAYLETDLSPEELEKNPFGMGQNGGHSIPSLESLTPDQVELENIDTPDELTFGATMTRERKIYIDAAAQLPNSAPTAGGSGGGSGNSVKLKMKEISSYRKAMEATGSPEPHLGSRRSSFGSEESDLEGDDGDKSRSPSPARLRLILKAPSRSAGSQRNKQDTNVIKTQAALREAKCQLEIQKLLRHKDKRSRNQRYRLGPLLREWNKIKNLDPLYDSDRDDTMRENEDVAPTTTSALKSKKKKPVESEAHANGTSNGSATDPNSATMILPGPANRKIEIPGDYGEESTAMATAFRRSSRWIGRWSPKTESDSSSDDKLKADRDERLARQQAREVNEIQNIEIMLREENEKALAMERDLILMREKEMLEKSYLEEERLAAGGKPASKSKSSKSSAKKRKAKEGEDMMGVMDADEEGAEKKKSTPAPRKSRKRKDSNEPGGPDKKPKLAEPALPAMVPQPSIVSSFPPIVSDPQSGVVPISAQNGVAPVAAVPQPVVMESMPAPQPPPQPQEPPAVNGSPPSVMSLGNLLD